MSEENRDTKLREHLANERTYLAWIRTSVALMGLGFVIVKFALFLKEISVIMADSKIAISEGFSAAIGVVMVTLGVVLAIFAFFQYKKVEKQINRQTYKSSSPISILLTLAILIGGIILIIDLLTSISFN
ncbi:MAG: YidH family protein [Bacteroidota bacterium]